MVSLWYICDIYVTCDIYLNCLCQWNAKNKKNCNFGWFAECNGHGTRQSWETLPNGRTLHSAKIFFKKKQKIFAEWQAGEALGKSFLKKLKNVFAECAPPWHSGKSFKKNVFAECLAAAALGKEFLKKNKKCLCRVPKLSALGKDAVKGAAPLTAAFLCRAPLLALGKCFAECPTTGPRQRASLPLNFFSEGSLPRAALVKAFAEGF